jgi:hypothetical protein
MFMRKNSDCFWHISFEDQGILHIPRILINDGTKSDRKSQIANNKKTLNRIAIQRKTL